MCADIGGNSGLTRSATSRTFDGHPTFRVDDSASVPPNDKFEWSAGWQTMVRVIVMPAGS